MNDYTKINLYPDPPQEEQHGSGTSPTEIVCADDEILELNDAFDFGGFQVVRREFFAHSREPSITFNDRKINVNTACLTKFPNVDYVQVLINSETKIMALRPCTETARDSFQWCTYSKGKRKPRGITCTLFFMKIFDMMKWNTEYRYKLLGNMIHANGEYLLAFDLSSTEVYQRNTSEKAASMTPVYPASWQSQFGLPFYEHRQSMLVNIFDGYAVYSLKDNKTVPIETNGIVPYSADTLPETRHGGHDL